MRAVRYSAFQQLPEIVSVADPECPASGVVIEVAAIDRADVNLVRVPDDMELETAASLGCRFSTAYRAVVHHGKVREGDWVAVHGCGGVGLSAVMIAGGRLHPERLVTRRLTLDQAPAALAGLGTEPGYGITMVIS